MNTESIPTPRATSEVTIRPETMTPPNTAIMVFRLSRPKIRNQESRPSPGDRKGHRYKE